MPAAASKLLEGSSLTTSRTINSGMKAHLNLNAPGQCGIVQHWNFMPPFNLNPAAASEHNQQYLSINCSCIGQPIQQQLGPIDVSIASLASPATCTSY